jgi:hypothetical protein
MFIIGPPRCGSTFLFAILTTQARFGYFSNVSQHLFAAPSLAMVTDNALRRAGARPPSLDGIRYGHVRGALGPSECSRFWYEWFDRSGAWGDGATPEGLRATLEFMTARAGRPLLFKNLFNSRRIRALRAAMPEALFVVVKRDELAVARSILQCRLAAGVPENQAWWSVPPLDPDRSLERLPLNDRVAHQAVEIYREIFKELGEHHPSRWMELPYDDLVSNPAGAVDAVATLYQRCSGQAVLLGRGQALDVPARVRRTSAEPTNGLADALRRLGYPNITYPNRAS